MTKAAPHSLDKLRTLHPTLRYERVTVTPTAAGLSLQFEFVLAPSITFTPSLTIPCASPIVDSKTHRLAFLIGMVELLSYWKLACPARIEVAAGHLTPEEVQFWEQLLRNGLGEFFYVNEIPPSLDVSIECVCTEKPSLVTSGRQRSPDPSSYLVLVGGGKDSIVTLELLKRTQRSRAISLSSFVLNPIPASLSTIQAAGYPQPLVSSRKLDPQLLELNSQGYLNGHTPFSALLAFTSTLVAYQNRIAYVLASNESSASEGNIHYDGFEINHQYSKSFEFESLYREYILREEIPVDYFSFLRPINELQICAIFSTFPHQHTIFRSCNREQTLRARARYEDAIGANGKIRGWCAECPKCIFTYLCLSCFLSPQDVLTIFGVDPGATPLFIDTAKQLAGLSEHKPFECVGTYEEVQAALQHLLSSSAWLQKQASEVSSLRNTLNTLSIPSVKEILERWNPSNFVDPSFCSDIRQQLAVAMEALKS